MSRKLGALMLSFLLVMLSVIGAFAVTVDDLSVEEDSDYASYTLTEGYNYRTRIFADINADYVPDKVSWEVYPADPSDNFLTWRLVSNDTMIVLEGVLPAYSETSNDHVYHVIAHISGDVASKDANGDDVYDDETGDQIFISGDISMDVSYGDGLTITPDEDYTLVGLFPEMLTISYDSSVVESRDVVRDEYSVSIIFKTSADQVPVYERDSDGEIVYDEETYDPITTGALKDGNIYVLLQIDASDLEYLKEYINLPSWLAYEVVSSQDSYQYDEYSDETTPDGYNYIKELRIFYSSDHEPQDGAKGTIRITGGMFDYNYTGYVDPDGTDPTWQSDPTIGWSVAYSAVPPVTLESTDIEISPDCDVSVDLTIGYTKQEPVSIEFTPDISEHVKLSADWTTTVFEEENMVGTIALHVEPITIADATYSTDMVVTDANGKTATAHITVNVVVPSIVVEPATVDIISAYGGSADKAVTWSRVKPIGYTYSPDIEEGFGLSVESDDSTITIAIAPTISADWTGILTILDAYGKSADISLYLQSVVSGEITIDAEVSGDATATTFTAGEPFTVTLNAGNTYGAVTWNLVNQEALEGYSFTITSLSDTVYTFTMPEWVSGTYSADFRATDESGRDAGQYVFTFTVGLPPIVLSGDFGTISLTYPSSGDASIDYLKALPVDWTISPDISADVSIDIAVIPANSTEITGKITVTATPKTIADETYETAIYFTDENGNTDSADLTVAVAVPSITITPTSATLEAYTGESDSAKFTYTGPAPIGWTTDASTLDFTLNVTSDDSAITVTATPINPVTLDATLTILDAYGKSADIALTLKGNQSGNIGVTSSGDVSEAEIVTGNSSSVTLTAGNTYGTISWSIANLSYLQGLGFTVSPTSTTGSTATFTFTAPDSVSGTYSADITAKDETGRTAGHYTFTMNVVLPPMVISGDFGTISVVYGSSADATVEYYDADPVSWTIDPDISADVSIDVVFVSADSDVVEGTITVTATPLTALADTYSTVIYFTDANGYVTSADLNIAVTLPKIAVTPSSVTVDAASSATGWSGAGTLGYTGTAPVSYTATPEVPSGFRFTVTSADGTITLAINPELSFILSDYPATTKRYDGTLTFTDAYGGAADVTLRLQASDPSLFTISGTAPTMTITAGDSATMSFTARNNRNNAVTWSVRPTSSNGVTASISPASSGSTSATLTVSVAESATAGSVNLTVLAEANLGAGLSLPASYDVAVTVRAKTISDDKPESEDKPASNGNTVSNKPVSQDSGLTSLVSNGYIKSNGAISDNAFADGSDKPTSSFRTSGNTYSKRLVMAFAVRVWYIYLGGTQYGPFSASTVGATTDSPVTITPDANDPTAATVEIDRTQLTTTTQEVDLGVVPEASTNDTIVKSNIGTVSSTTSSGGTGENITSNNTPINPPVPGNTTTLGASGGGCASGFGAAVMALAAAFIIRKKR